MKWKNSWSSAWSSQRRKSGTKSHFPGERMLRVLPSPLGLSPRCSRLHPGKFPMSNQKLFKQSSSRAQQWKMFLHAGDTVLSPSQNYRTSLWLGLEITQCSHLSSVGLCGFSAQHSLSWLKWELWHEEVHRIRSLLKAWVMCHLTVYNDSQRKNKLLQFRVFWFQCQN